MRAIALVLAAGAGERLGGDRPKALLSISGRSLAEWSCRALAECPSLQGVLPVLPASHLELGRFEGAKLLAPVAGGATRQESLARALAALRERAIACDFVLVHDAARCLVRPEDAERALEAVRATGAALPVVPVGDTIKEVDGERVLKTLERARLAAAQTPQAFARALLESALAQAERAGFVGTDCASLVERFGEGAVVRIFPGRAENFKVTHREDLRRAELALGRSG